MDVWHWVADNWPLLLSILLGPIGIAVFLIVKNFGTIRDIVGAAVGFIQGVWGGLVGFFQTIIGWIGAIIGGVWHVASDAAGFVAGLVIGAWQGVVNFFTGIPGQLAGVFSGMWDGIWNAFKGVINLVIDGWNRLHFTTPHVSFLGVDTPSITIGMPQIPRLASGGIVTGPTLALLGEGGPEAVVPLGRMGPAVVIQTANFSTELDVEAFMRRAAWTVQTQRI
jgi:hypothetical protein